VIARPHPHGAMSLAGVAQDGTLQRSVLPSGLRVVTEQMAGSRSAAVGMWVAVGSRDEPAPVAGAAHYYIIKMNENK